MNKLHGIVCANITPMHENGTIDLESLRNLVDRVAGHGINGIYPCGTNGEGISLQAEEHFAIAKTVAEQSAGRIDVYIQCATISWYETMDNIRRVRSLPIDGVGVMTPSFYKTDDISIEEYYRDVSEAAGDLYVYMYNIPQNTNNDISVSAFGKIIDTYHNIIGIKYSNGDIKRIQDYMLAPKTRKADVLIGADSLIVSALAAGCVGEVSGPSCVFPKRFSSLYDAWRRGDLATALEMQTRIVSTARMIQSVPQIPAIKAMLKMQGIIESDTCRRPFRKLTTEELKILEKAVDQYETKG